MVNIQKVESYKTSDGKVFKTKEAAEYHAAIIEGNIKLKDDLFFYYGGLSGISNVDDLVKFINRNKDWILPLVKE